MIKGEWRAFVLLALPRKWRGTAGVVSGLHGGPRPRPGQAAPGSPLIDSTDCLESCEPLSWEALESLAAPEPDLIQGPTSAQARLRLFGQPEASVRVTLYRDHHAWCPYCKKVWLWLEERRIPYRFR